MIGIQHFGTFLFAGILLNLTPGNDTMYILSRSIAQGKRAGVYSGVGIGTGLVIHTLFAAFGLSFIISQSIVLFNIIKYVGACYLLYVGVMMWLKRAELSPNNNIGDAPLNKLRIYRDAVFTNVLNPKVALFFISFLPQFIDTVHKQTIVPFLLLGFTFTFTGTLWCFVIAIFSADIFLKLRSHRNISSLVNKACGTILISLGIKLAFSERK